MGFTVGAMAPTLNHLVAQRDKGHGVRICMCLYVYMCMCVCVYMYVFMCAYVYEYRSVLR